MDQVFKKQRIICMLDSKLMHYLSSPHGIQCSLELHFILIYNPLQCNQITKPGSPKPSFNNLMCIKWLDRYPQPFPLFPPFANQKTKHNCVLPQTRQKLKSYKISTMYEPTIHNIKYQISVLRKSFLFKDLRRIYFKMSTIYIRKNIKYMDTERNDKLKHTHIAMTRPC